MCSQRLITAKQPRQGEQDPDAKQEGVHHHLEGDSFAIMTRRRHPLRKGPMSKMADMAALQPYLPHLQPKPCFTVRGPTLFQGSRDTVLSHRVIPFGREPFWQPTATGEQDKQAISNQSIINQTQQ